VTGRVLVVDDEVAARTTLADMLRDGGYEVEMAADAFKALGKYETFAPRVVVTDLQMPGMDGLELVRRIRAGSDPAAVIVMTAFGAVQSAVDAMHAGAADYLTKPFDLETLVALLERAFEREQLQTEARRPSVHGAPGKLVGSTPAMLRILEDVEQIGASRASVLITGEAGTGKEVIAHAIHLASTRAQRPIVTLHCAGLSEAQLEVELFGQERGATGTLGHREGRLVHANGSTLFIDEIAELSPLNQIRLLRFLDEHQLERAGGTQPIRVDARVIAATCRDLGEEVAHGRFRADLYYRLRGVAIAVPPLRDRMTDLPKLVKAFIRKYATANGKLIDGVSPEALDLLAGYAWPGNIRELENAIENAVVLSHGPTIDVRALPQSITSTNVRRGAPRIPGSTMADIERYAIVETMQATGGSTSKAAEILGISTRTVQYRLHQYHEAQRSELDVVRKPADK
jgi:DNA-binding NtrC family response regulator